MKDSGVLSFLCSCFLIVSTTFAESSFTEKCLLVASECQRYGYEVSRFPNVNKDQDAENARKAMWTYDPMYQQSSPDCKADIKLILCLVYFPLCLETNSVPAGPCAPFCSSTTMRCNVFKHGFGHPLASSLNCNLLPAVSSDSRPCVNSTDDVLKLMYRYSHGRTTVATKLPTTAKVPTTSSSSRVSSTTFCSLLTAIILCARHMYSQP